MIQLTTDNPTCILLTGATGFLGKVVLEELFRRRREYKLGRVLVLIRPSAESTSIDRFIDEVASSPCFSKLKKNWLESVDVIEGDLSSPLCGLDDITLASTCLEVTHIINCAGSAKAELPLAEAASSNITSVLNLLDFAKCCPRLQGMVTASSAYVAPKSSSTIKETLPALPCGADQLYDDIQNLKVSESGLLRTTGYLNTYTLTKCIAEHMLLLHKDDVPLTIVRPSVICGSWKYPSPGWIDKQAGVSGLIALLSTGYLQVINAHADVVADLVPVDFVASDMINEARIIACAPPPYMAEPPRFNSDTEDISQPPEPIVHSVAGIENGIRFRKLVSSAIFYFNTHPSSPPSYSSISKPKSGSSVPSATAPKVSVHYIGPRRGLRYQLDDLGYHRLPLGLRRLYYQGISDYAAARKIAAVSAGIRKANGETPWFLAGTWDFRPSTSSADGRDTSSRSRSGKGEIQMEQRKTGWEDFEPEKYIAIMCAGVQKWLLAPEQ